MSQYVEKNLRPSETIIAKAKVSYVALVPTVIGSLILIIIGIVLISTLKGSATGFGLGIGIPLLTWGITAIIVQAIRLSNVELGVTNKKIIGKTGIVAAKSIDSYLEKIDNFSISETLGGKIFGYATIMICTTSMVMRFPFIKDAMGFKNTVMDCVDAREQQKMIDQANFIKGGAPAQSYAPAPAPAPAPAYSHPAPAPGPAYSHPAPAPAHSNPTPAPAPAPAHSNPAPDKLVCRKCGTVNTPGSGFCASCGSRLN